MGFQCWGGYANVVSISFILLYKSETQRTKLVLNFGEIYAFMVRCVSVKAHKKK